MLATERRMEANEHAHAAEVGWTKLQVSLVNAGVVSTQPSTPSYQATLTTSQEMTLQHQDRHTLFTQPQLLLLFSHPDAYVGPVLGLWHFCSGPNNMSKACCCFQAWLRAMTLLSFGENAAGDSRQQKLGFASPAQSHYRYWSRWCCDLLQERKGRCLPAGAAACTGAVSVCCACCSTWSYEIPWVSHCCCSVAQITSKLAHFETNCSPELSTRCTK